MIKANFNAYASYITDTLYQWDLNQTLVLTGLNLASAPEVHFSNANMDRAIVRQATNIDQVVRVEIPNSILQDPLTIQAYVGIYEGETFKVIEKVVIPVYPRKRPFDYVIQGNDDEIYSFKALENKLENVIGELQAQYAAVGVALDEVNDGIIQVVAHTLKADEWGTDLYNLEDRYPPDKYHVQIALDALSSEEAVEAFHNARIVGSSTRNLFRAYNGQPSVDIPVILTVIKK